MGVTGGDYDGDGMLDLMVTNWEAELHASTVARGRPARIPQDPRSSTAPT